MRRILLLSICAVACVGTATPQGNPIDWPSFGGDAQRSGWEKSDSRITRDNVKDFQLVVKHKLGTGSGNLHSLTPPVVIGRLISYKGFKELAFVTGAGDRIWALDADLDRIFWEKKLASTPGKPKDGSCAGIVPGMAALTPPVAFGGGRPRPGPGAPPGAAGSAAIPGPTPAGSTAPVTPPASPGILGGTGFGAPRPVFVLSSDGKLHAMNTSTGEDQVPPIDFLPANAKASPLTIADNTIYTTTSALCSDSPNAVWAMDLSQSTPTAESFPLSDGAPAGTAGLAVAANGTVFVQVAKGPLHALTSKQLKPKKDFMPEGGGSNATPVVFTHKSHEYVATAGMDGRVYLLDAETLAVISTSEAIGAGGAQAGLASWQTPDGARWIIAPAGNKIVGLTLEDGDSKPVLKQNWSSAAMVNPLSPVLTGGMAFILDAGKGKSGAKLYALDALTGKELYNTGNQVTVPAQLTGLSIVNARVYFTTTDNTLYAFGVFLER